MATASDIIKAAENSSKYNKEHDSIVTSFTEPDLFIYSKPGIHSCFVDSKAVKGGSTFKNHFVPEFKGEERAYGLAKHWKVHGKDILKLWKDKGESTSSFGTGLHKIMECENNGEEWTVDLIEEPLKRTRITYMENFAIGEEIFQNSKSAKENYAKATHLDIRELMKASTEMILNYAKGIVSEFKNMYGRIGYSPYDSLAEVYVTYSKYNMGGEIDHLIIIDNEKKICRVADHKFKDKVLDELSSNIKLTNELEKKKASELDIIRIQLSFYAFCLTKAGWTVEGGDVFGRNGVWSHYPVDLIPTNEMEVLLDKYLK